MRKIIGLYLTTLLFFVSCTYLRETPSYRETGNTHPSSSPTRQKQTRVSSDNISNNDFYRVQSQKFGYQLNGNENPDLLKEIETWLGVPYKYGGNNMQGVDCSGLATRIYQTVYNIDLERVTINMAQRTRRINQRQLREGDLVFFKINRRKVSHVGIYISNGRFVHASTSRGVIISYLGDDYYKRRFAFGGRVLR
jgi:lipoprotein Spr